VSARRQRPAIALLLVLLAAAALRVAAALTLGDVTELHGDEGYYVRGARALAAGAGYPGSLRPPGYSAFLAAVFALAGDSLRAARLAQSAVALVGIAALYAMVRRRFGARAATLSALLCALHPTLVFYSHVFWSETLVATLLLLAFDCLDRFASGAGEAWLGAAGVVLGATILTRDMLLFFVPVVVAWACIARAATPRAMLRRAALVLVPVALVLLPWMARNHARTGRLFVLSTNSWYPLAVGNLIPRDRILGMADENRAFNREFYALGGDEAAQNAFARQSALRAIGERQPGWIVHKLLRNTYYLFSTASQAKRFVKEDWLAPGWRQFTRRMTVVEAAFYIAQMVLGVIALWLVPGGRTKALVVALIVFHWGVYLVANATNRFRVPLLPFFLLYVGPLLAGAARRARPARWRLVGAAACLAAFAAIVLTPYVRGPLAAPPDDGAGDATWHARGCSVALAGTGWCGAAGNGSSACRPSPASLRTSS
jgi:4-amino-4-deoxy-L-arabinose transferase-like glycosyltransferase